MIVHCCVLLVSRFVFFFNDTAATEIYTYLTHSFPTRRSSDLVGGSGSGKSVLLNTILGLKQPDGGTVEILGRNIEDEDAQAWVGRHVDRKSTRLNSSH